MVQTVNFHPGHVCSPTTPSERRPVIHVDAFILYCSSNSRWKYLEKINVPGPLLSPFLLFYFFFFSYLHKHKCTDLQNRTGTYTQAGHPSHVIALGIMPMAKHVTYQKSLWDIARERGGVVCVSVCVCVCVGEIRHICQFLRAPCQV